MRDAISLKDAPLASQESWAVDRGRQLWDKVGDDKIVREMSEEENEEDRKEAWFVAWNEHENELQYDLKVLSATEWNQDEGVVQYNERRFDTLRSAIESGFKQAYNSAAGISDE